MSLPETPSQTVGPYFSIGLPWEDGAFVVPEGTEGALWLHGRILDGEGAPIPDARGRDLAGRPRRPLRRARLPRLRSRPDRRGRPLARPHAQARAGRATRRRTSTVAIFARGLLRQVLTRIYFPDEAERNAADPVLSSLDADARATLVAQPSDDGYAFDIHMQGPHATAFFAF